MRKLVLILGMTLAVLLAVWGEGKAQGLQVAAPLQKFTLNSKEAHSAKFLCGKITAPSPLALGTYLTVINVRNLSFTKAATVGLWREDILIVDYIVGTSLSLSCTDLVFLFDPSSFSEGFVTLQLRSGPGPLHVVAVYTLSP